MICFHFSIFEPLETTCSCALAYYFSLWFAFILVSLNHWKQHGMHFQTLENVVICFHFSIFEPLETTIASATILITSLWFAFILVSLNHWKQQHNFFHDFCFVVICFHFSIFEPLETTQIRTLDELVGCDLLSF